MKLFVLGENNKKIYIDKVASTRWALAQKINSDYLAIEGRYYTVNEVYAESQSKSDAIVGTIAGVALGAITGGIGLLIGGIGGAVLGNYTESEELKKVKNFNNSYVRLH